MNAPKAPSTPKAPAPFPPARAPDRVPAKTFAEELQEIKIVAEKAASRAEIAYLASDRAEEAARRAEAAATVASNAVKEMSRKELDAEGRPGLLPWIGNELVMLRRDVHPVHRAKVYAVCIVLALLAGATSGGLLTCISQGKILTP